MESGIRTKKLRIGGMTCASCQNKIEKKLRNTAGVLSAEVSYSMGTALVTYDTDILSQKDISVIIEKLDYEVLQGGDPMPGSRRVVGILIIIVALYALVSQFGLASLANAFPLAETGMGYGMLFVIGLITSVHCVAMCGGINLSQCIPQSAKSGGRTAALRPSLLYNLGRVVSYTAVGGIVGALGSVVSLSGGFRGIVQLAAGVFMIIMGINMLGVFPALRRFTPRMPRVFARRIDAEKGKSKSPLIVGLLNGLMPCGPLQAMQLYALSTGSPATGALSMMLFSLGTVPLMFGLGALSSVLSKKFTRKVMTVGAVLVMVLGLSMFSRGWTLSGITFPDILPANASVAQEEGQRIQIENGVQMINSSLASGHYPAITVQAGTPVKWTIDAPKGSVNGCNNRIFIPEYGIEYKFRTGENVIEFTPTETGKFPYSCWMGMIRSSITVVEPDAAAPDNNRDAPDSYDGYTNGYDTDYGFDIAPDALADPIPANIAIPTDALAVAEFGTGDVQGEEYDIQRISIDLTDDGYSPAIVVVQGGTDAEWTINNTSTADSNYTMLVPFYNTRLDLLPGENPLYLFPTEYFTFSNGDNTFYGYVKVVDNLNEIDKAAIKAEVAAYETLIYPPEVFEGGGGAPSCH